MQLVASQRIYLWGHHANPVLGEPEGSAGPIGEICHMG